MDLPDIVLDFLDEAVVLDNVMLPQSYADPDDFAGFQTGFRTAPGGADLCGGLAGWQASWWVTCLNQRGEPFFINSDEAPDYPVYFAYQGSARWQAIPLTDCLADFCYLLGRLQDLEADPRRAGQWLEQQVDVDNEVWGDVWSHYSDDIGSLERRPVIGIDAPDYVFGRALVRDLGDRPDQVLTELGHYLNLGGGDLAKLAQEPEIVVRRDRFVNLRELIDRLTGLGAAVMFAPDED
jgi:hypothetical protein